MSSCLHFLFTLFLAMILNQKGKRQDFFNPKIFCGLPQYIIIIHRKRRIMKLKNCIHLIEKIQFILQFYKPPGVEDPQVNTVKENIIPTLVKMVRKTLSKTIAIGIDY